MFAIVSSVLVLAPATLFVHVEGDGYLRFAVDGRIVYAKSAKLASRGGLLAHENGSPVLPSMSIPSNASAIEVDASGTVSVSLAEGKAKIGRLILAGFPADEAMAAKGAFLSSQHRPNLGFAGEGTFGKIVSDGAPVAIAKSTTNPTAHTTLATPAKPTAQFATGHLTVTISQDKVEIESARVLLKDFAKVEGGSASSAQELDFGPTLPVSVPMRITRDRMLSRLRSLGLKDSDFDVQMPAIVEVWRKGQHITQAQFGEAATNYAGSEFGNPGAWTSGESGPDFLAPSGNVTLKAESARLTENSATIIVAIWMDDKRLNSRTVHVDCSQPLLEGVKAGQSVKVKFVCSGICAEVDGRAKTSARIGQSVEISVSMNPGEAPTSHTGTVIAPGQVEVKL